MRGRSLHALLIATCSAFMGVATMAFAQTALPGESAAFLVRLEHAALRGSTRELTEIHTHLIRELARGSGHSPEPLLLSALAIAPESPWVRLVLLPALERAAKP